MVVGKGEGDASARCLQEQLYGAHKYRETSSAVRLRVTRLALRYAPQRLDQLEPLFGTVSLLDLVQPGHGQLHHTLDGALQLAVLLAQRIDAQVELRVVSRVVLQLDDRFHESRGRLQVRTLRDIENEPEDLS